MKTMADLIEPVKQCGPIFPIDSPICLRLYRALKIMGAVRFGEDVWCADGKQIYQVTHVLRSDIPHADQVPIPADEPAPVPRMFEETIRAALEARPEPTGGYFGRFDLLTDVLEPKAADPETITLSWAANRIAQAVDQAAWDAISKALDLPPLPPADPEPPAQSWRDRPPLL